MKRLALSFILSLLGVIGLSLITIANAIDFKAYTVIYIIIFVALFLFGLLLLMVEVVKEYNFVKEK